MSKPNPTPKANSIPVITSKFIVPCKKDIHVTKKGSLLVNNTLIISDLDYNLKLKAVEINTKVHSQRLIKDIKGKPIVMLRKKIISVHGRWQAFKGESNDKKDLIFSTKRRGMFSCKLWDVYLAKNTIKEDHPEVAKNTTKDDDPEVVKNTTQEDSFEVAENTTQEDDDPEVAENTTQEDDDREDAEDTTQEDDPEVAENITQEDDPEVADNTTHEEDPEVAKNTIKEDDPGVAKNTNKEDYPDFRIEGKWPDCRIYAADSATVIAELHRKNPEGYTLAKNKFIITVYPGVDYAFIVALIAILDARHGTIKAVVRGCMYVIRVAWRSITCNCL